MKHYLLYLWTTKQGERRVADRLVLSFLICMECFYRIGFWLWQTLRAPFMPAKKLPSRVISIGNLSVGGTGKTVFVQFLADLLSHRNVAIITRGYGGSLAKTNDSFIINDGSKLLFSVQQTGDEAYMLAQRLKIPVVIGNNRHTSYKKLVNKTGVPGVTLLDDAYQNHQVQKDYEILLVDARKPLENNHCLPAGPLREKDYTRANCIILTHADCINPAMLPVIKKKYFPCFDATKIFTGKHATTRLYDTAGCTISPQELSVLTFLCFAGIGSFSGYLETVNHSKLSVGHAHEFDDHHRYTENDIAILLSLAQQHCCSALVTTEKDWVKVAPLINQKSSFPLPIYILAVEFEFLSPQEYSFFVDELNRKI